MTYMHDRYYARKHVHEFLFSAKFFFLIIASLTYPYMAFIGLIFDNIIETCLKGIGHGGYE